MTLPIQTAPIERANRVASLTAAANVRGMKPQIDLGDIIGVGSVACAFLPPPFSLICSVLANQLAR